MSEKLENKIMGKIESGKIKLKSKYIFWAEKLGLQTAFTFSIILSVVAFNLILFYLKETDNLKYLSFGKIGIFAFLESFPYLLVISFILLIVLSGYIITKSDASYKNSFSKMVVFMILLIIFFGGALTFTVIPKEIEKYSRDNSMKIFLPIDDIREKSVSGIIFEKYDNSLIIKTPQGLRRIIFEKDYKLEKGQFIVSIGQRNNFDFFAHDIKIVRKEDLPAIERGINFRFGENNRIPKQLLFFEEAEKECISKCLEVKDRIGECIRSCRLF
jgi:hypothetical protein